MSLGSFICTAWISQIQRLGSFSAGRILQVRALQQHSVHCARTRLHGKVHLETRKSNPLLVILGIEKKKNGRVPWFPPCLGNTFQETQRRFDPSRPVCRDFTPCSFSGWHGQPHGEGVGLSGCGECWPLKCWGSESVFYSECANTRRKWILTCWWYPHQFCSKILLQTITIYTHCVCFPPFRVWFWNLM